MSETGISVAVLKGANKPEYIAPDMSQDHLEALEGDFGALDVVVQHNDGGVREVIRRLPSHLEVSPHN
jgi:hypothetical protein